ncbi:MAG: ribosomal protein S18-alanine N-acetyltransferase, partial [Thermomicrobiaceae bacterium]
MTLEERRTQLKPYYYLESMQVEDVAEVSQLDHRCFTNPWPQSAYRRELSNPEGNFYIVLRQRLPGAQLQAESETENALTRVSRWFWADERQQDPIVGYAGMWIRAGEAHVTTIGVAPELRGRGFGELLLVSLFEESIARGAEWVTLEVRVSNTQAQRLYEKYGMSRHGVRRRYYSDNGEDADIMWSDSLLNADYVSQVEQLRDQLADLLIEQGLILSGGDSED